MKALLPRRASEPRRAGQSLEDVCHRHRPGTTWT
jgi:hypothetical protein